MVTRSDRRRRAVFTALVVLNPATLAMSVVYLLAAVLTGARVGWDRDQWMVRCTGAARRLHGGGGTAVGCVFVTSRAAVSSRLMRHEGRHRDQWAVAGPLFPLLYGLEALRTRGQRHRIAYERWAGLEDGGYRRT